MDKIKDKVSVIIPVYNSEKTIVQVLDSVKQRPDLIISARYW